MDEGLFHLSVKMVQRSKGRSATGAIAYRAGTDITDERTGLRFDYRKKRGVSHSAIILPSGAPDRFKDRSILWNEVEKRETRKNSAVAREFECALPYDLPRHVREQIGRDFAQFIVDRYNVAADINFHDPHPRIVGEDGQQSKNYHFHLLTSTREVTEDGFTDKVRVLDSATTGSEEVYEVRTKYAEMVNHAYAVYGVSKFVDHRSNEARGIDEEPQLHVGPNQNGDRAGKNAAIIAAREHLAALQREHETIQLQIKGLLQQLGPVGDADRMVELGPVAKKRRLSPETAAQPATKKSDSHQPKSDSTKHFIVSPVEQSKPATTTHTEVGSLNKVLRVNELEQLKKKARTFGRAMVNLHEQQSLAASFKRELDDLKRPGLVHRFLRTHQWLAYEDKYLQLSARVQNAEVKSRKLQVLAKEYKSFQTEWDRTGYFEHKALVGELAYDQGQRIAALPNAVTPAPTFASPIWVDTNFRS